MYKELIERLRTTYEEDPLVNPEILLEAADAIESLDDIAQTYAETVQELKMKSQWIPVTERLPENDYNCIVFSDGYVREAHFYFGKFYDPVEDYMQYKATHWMPLPEPPKED